MAGMGSTALVRDLASGGYSHVAMRLGALVPDETTTPVPRLIRTYIGWGMAERRRVA